MKAGPRREEPMMGLDDKAANSGQNLGGKVKEAAGKVTGNRDLEAEGKGDQAAASAKQAGEKVKDAAKDILN
jgi:uncharacterized protein YjbJ (UPF0337 family)